MEINKDKLITIIFPSRGRYELTKRLLLSIEEKTHIKNWIEVISICDHDDKKTLDLFHEISSKITYDFKFVSRKQNKILDLPNDYYDIGLKLASDSYFTWILGNDCEINSNKWDLDLYLFFNSTIPQGFNNIEKNERYYYIKISDDTHWDKNGNSISKIHSKSCCFPIISSNYCTTLGEFYPIEIPTWGGDLCLYDFVKASNIFDEVDAINILSINHHSFHNNKNKQDEMYNRSAESTKLVQGSEGWYQDGDGRNVIFNQKRQKYLIKNK